MSLKEKRREEKMGRKKGGDSAQHRHRKHFNRKPKSDWEKWDARDARGGREDFRSDFHCHRYASFGHKGQKVITIFC